MNSDLILSIVLGSIVAGAIGVGFAKFSAKIKEKNEIKNAKDFLEGKKSNIVEMDDEKIHVNKFISRERDGNRVVLDIPYKHEKVAQKAPNKA